MIDKLERNRCVGCSVCHDVCPTGAITMIKDREGFKYPEINDSTCINCDLCEKTCPVLQKDSIVLNNLLSEVQCYAAQHKSYPVRFESTSGGVFSALATVIYKRGGYVAGAVRTEDGYVEHFVSNNRKDLLKLRQSKYTQSYTEGIYGKVRELLKNGKEVLVCGTPCQMAGLRRFLKKEYANLYIVDFICNNVFSPYVWNVVKAHIEKVYGSPLSYTKYKDKELGWRNRTSRYDLKDGRTIYSPISDYNLFDVIYHKHPAARPSCYSCPFKGYPRYSDLTFADYWGCEKHHPNLDDNIGTSAVICTTTKGLDIFNDAKVYLNCEDSKLEWIQARNPSLLKVCAEPTFNRTHFFDDLLNGIPVDEVCKKYFKSNRKKRFVRDTLKKFRRGIRRKFKIFRRALKIAQYRPRPFLQFVYYNFIHPAVIRKNGSCFYIAPMTYIEMSYQSKMILEGDFTLGKHRLKRACAHSELWLNSGSSLHVKKSSYFMYGASLHILKGGSLNIESVYANTQTSIVCSSSVKLGDGCMIGRNVSIRDENSHVIAIEGYKTKSPVVIGNHTWLCSGSSVAAGTHVGTGAVVGACAFASGKIPEHSLVMGNPGKVVMKDIAWKY